MSHVRLSAPKVTTRRISTTEAPWVQWTLIALALGFMALFLVMPLLAVFVEALRKGGEAYLEALKEPDAWSAIRLTLLIAAITVPLN
jgi:sulfate transport system permease protein